MAQINLPEDLSRRLRELAERQNRSVEDVLEQLLDEHTSPPQQQPDLDDPAIRELRRKLYRIARDYWREAGDEQRLALTDEQLDEQFWLIDHKGIPRLKEDQGKMEIPPNPLEAMAGILGDEPPTDVALDAMDGMFDDDVTDLSTTVRETMREYWKRRARPD